MPATAPYTKVTHTEDHGATVVLFGDTVGEAARRAEELAEVDGLVLVHPYDDPEVMAGQGTVAIELLDDHDDLEVVVVPVGGGGLVSGMATVVKDRRPDIEVIGVQSETYPSMIAALVGGEFTGSSVDTLADGIAVKTPGRNTVPIVAALVDDVVTVSEERIEDAIRLYLEVEKTVAEGAGAAALAAVLDDPERFRGRRVAVVLSGGNIDSRVLASVLMRGLVRTGRLTALRVPVDDLPGRLASVASLIAEAGANIIEVEHRRLFDPVSARSTGLALVIETRDRHHADEVIDHLRSQGYDARPVA